MSKATKRKHVTREVLDDFIIPEDDQTIVKILSSRGNNLHEAETPAGNFVVVDPIKEGHKVCAEIVHILYPEQIKYLKKEGLWPEKFIDKASQENGCHDVLPQAEISMKDQGCQGSCSDGESETDDDGDLFVNTNHVQSLVICSDSDSSDEESAKESSDEDNTEATNFTENNNMNKIK